jgi:predicted PurR-regulated permease PerM
LAENVAHIGLPQLAGTTLINLGVATLVVNALYFGREILVPVALAVLFSFVLAPFVIRLQSWRVPRTLSVLVAVFIGFAIIFSLGGLMVSQATRLADDLPGYQQTLGEKVRVFAGSRPAGPARLSVLLKYSKNSIPNCKILRWEVQRQMVYAGNHPTDLFLLK